MFVTFLVLVVFESATSDPSFQEVETFMVYEAMILVVELLIYLCRTGNIVNYANFDP